MTRPAVWFWVAGMGLVIVGTAILFAFRAGGEIMKFHANRIHARAVPAAGAALRGTVLLIAGGGAVTVMWAVLWEAAWLAGLM